MPNEDTAQIKKILKDLETMSGKLTEFMRESENFDTGVGKDVEQIKKDITEIKILINNNYVRREEFNPVQKIVYGLVSILLMGVVGALMALVIK